MSKRAQWTRAAGRRDASTPRWRARLKNGAPHVTARRGRFCYLNSFTFDLHRGPCSPCRAARLVRLLLSRRLDRQKLIQLFSYLNLKINSILHQAHYLKFDVITFGNEIRRVQPLWTFSKSNQCFIKTFSLSIKTWCACNQLKVNTTLSFILFRVVSRSFPLVFLLL